MTPVDIVHQRRVAAVNHAIEIGNITEAARRFGVSRKTLSGWKKTFDRFGADGLRPKDRRPPAMPNQTPEHVIEELVRLAVTRPAAGARAFAAALSDDGWSISKSCVQTHLNRLGLGRRQQRLAAAGRLALFTKGLMITNPRHDDEEGPFGFCHWSPAPGRWVQFDCFYIGKLKAVGEVWQLTATDVRTRISDVLIAAGRPTSADTARFLRLVTRRWTRRRYPLSGVISDNGGEFKGEFTTSVAAAELVHVRTPARSPNHNAVVERFHQTMLEECWRPAFHQRFFTSIRQLQIHANSWLVGYHRRPNHGHWMHGRTPNQMLQAQ